MKIFCQEERNHHHHHYQLYKQELRALWDCRWHQKQVILMTSVLGKLTCWKGSRKWTWHLDGQLPLPHQWQGQHALILCWAGGRGWRALSYCQGVLTPTVWLKDIFHILLILNCLTAVQLSCTLVMRRRPALGTVLTNGRGRTATQIWRGWCSWLTQKHHSKCHQHHQQQMPASSNHPLRLMRSTWQHQLILQNKRQLLSCLLKLMKSFAWHYF